jgi:hypothetical protein
VREISIIVRKRVAEPGDIVRMTEARDHGDDEYVGKLFTVEAEAWEGEQDVEVTPPEDTDNWCDLLYAGQWELVTDQA